MAWNILGTEARLGNVDAVRRLVGELGADPHSRGDYGMTPLHRACQGGNLSVVRYLVGEAQVNVELTDTYGRTPLHYACIWNRFKIVQYLVETGGANIEARDNDGSTPLHIASRYNFFTTDIVVYLVEHRGANVNARTNYGNTPLDGALATRRGDHIRYLLPRTSSVAKESLVALWAHDNAVDIGVLLLEKYALGHGLANAFRRNPIHTLLSQFPLPSAKTFQDYIELFPSSVLCSLDEESRLSIHVALTSQNAAVKSPSLIAFLFAREPRLAVARDPTTGLYPHESAAGLVSTNGGDTDDCCWLDIVYKMLRSNPQHLLLQPRGTGSDLVRGVPVPNDQDGVVELPIRKRPKVEHIFHQGVG